MTRLERLLASTLITTSAAVAAGWAVATLAVSAPLVVGAWAVVGARDAAVSAHDGTVSR